MGFFNSLSTTIPGPYSKSNKSQYRKIERTELKKRREIHHRTKMLLCINQDGILQTCILTGPLVAVVQDPSGARS